MSSGVSAEVRSLQDSPSPSVAGAAPASAELDRLTRENDRLRAELTAARARLAEHDTQLGRTRESLEELRRPLSHDLLSSTLSARLKSGEAVVTGGYPLPDGGRLYAFVRPVVVMVDGVPQIEITSTFSLLDDEAGLTVGLDSIATNATNTLQHGEVWIGDEVDAVLSAIGQIPGHLGITLPDVSLRPGATASLRLDDPQLTLKVTPVLVGPDGDMDLDVRLEQTPPPPPPPPVSAPVESAETVDPVPGP